MTSRTKQLAHPSLIEGAIVESGSTPDGDYVRWENGWQVCTSEGVTLESSTTSATDSGIRVGDTPTWSYPAPFVSIPTPVASLKDFGTGASNQSAAEVRGTASSISSVDLFGYHFGSDTITLGLAATASGWWK